MPNAKAPPIFLIIPDMGTEVEGGEHVRLRVAAVDGLPQRFIQLVATVTCASVAPSQDLQPVHQRVAVADDLVQIDM